MLATTCLAAQTKTGYKLEGRYPVAGDGGWDYISLDTDARRLYVAHSDHVAVLDADSGKPAGKIEDTPGVHGAAIAPKLKRGFTSNGRENKVSMFDTGTLAVIKKIDVGRGPDAIYFDAGSGRVFTTDHGSHDITAIDAAKGEVAGTIKLEGDGEAMVANRDGLIFVGAEDKDEIVSFDPRTLEIKNRFPITGAKTPTGLAIDVKNNRLFIGCRSRVLAVMDAGNGRVLATFPIGSGVDAAAFDPQAGLIFASTGDGNISVFHQKSADVYEPMEAIATERGARTMIFDPKTKKIFLPAAEMAPSEPGQRPRPKPGTFVVLVAGK